MVMREVLLGELHERRRVSDAAAGCSVAVAVVPSYTT